MTRRELRENAFKMLFRIEFHDASEMPEQLELFTEEQEQLQGDDLAYLKKKCSDIIMRVGELDDEINRVSKGWKTSRMSKVDLCLIRVALYEMRHEDDIPVAVSINEAVELAKRYGTDDSASFVNGILAKLT